MTANEMSSEEEKGCTNYQNEGENYYEQDSIL
jgi:hypothetical protein